MADVFVSYKSEDRAHAERIAKALEAEGLSVWWDPALEAGQDYQQVIDENLRRALLVVVLWSSRSVQSRWVRSEATIGDRYGALAPVMIEPCERPVAFELLQTADLSQWSGDANDPVWREFVADVQNKLEQKRAAAAAPGAKPEPDAQAIETVFWESVEHSDDTADFRAYIQRYPKGHFTPLARNRLKALSHKKRRGGGFGWIVGVLAFAALGLAGVMLASNVPQLRPLVCYAAASGPFCGRYAATISERDPNGTEFQYALEVEFRRDRNSVAYTFPGNDCTGAWEFVSASQGRRFYREAIAQNPTGSCVSGAVVILTARPDGMIDYAWRSSLDEPVTVTGVLRRTEN